MKYNGELNCTIDCNLEMNLTDLLKRIVEFNERECLKANDFRIRYEHDNPYLGVEYILDYDNLILIIKFKSNTFSTLTIEKISLTNYGENVDKEYLMGLVDTINEIFEVV